MKRELSIAAIALALFVLQHQGHAQQMAYPPYIGYPQPMVYPQQMAYPPNVALMAAQPISPQGPVQDPVGNGATAMGAACPCNECCCEPCCCDPPWQFFGEFLYLRPRDAEVAYGVPQNGPISEPEDVRVQIGPTAVADFDYEPAFRAGFSGALGDCGRLGASYTRLEAQTSDSTSISPPYVLHSLVAHPGTASASQQFLDASAAYSMDFDLIDVDFSRIMSCSPRHKLCCVLGARYAGSQQDFIADFSEPTNREVVTTNIHFDGGGIRVGLDTEFYSANRCWVVYGRGMASFVAGEFRAIYTYDDLYGQQSVYTDWQAGRVVTMLDLEVGAGWTSPNGYWRLTGGYMVSGWFNALNADEFINAVQTNEFAGLSDTMTFDGAVARAELRF